MTSQLPSDHQHPLPFLAPSWWPFYFTEKKIEEIEPESPHLPIIPDHLHLTFPPAAVAELSLLRSRASTLSDTFSVPLRFSLLKDFALMLYSSSCLPCIPMCRVNILPVPLCSVLWEVKGPQREWTLQGLLYITASVVTLFTIMVYINAKSNRSNFE